MPDRSSSSRARTVLPDPGYEVQRFTGIPYPSGNHHLTRPEGSPLNGGGAERTPRCAPGAGRAHVYARRMRTHMRTHAHSVRVCVVARTHTCPPTCPSTRTDARRSKGVRASGAPPGSPLDDLLSHVNHLLRDFDTKFTSPLSAMGASVQGGRYGVD